MLICHYLAPFGEPTNQGPDAKCQIEPGPWTESLRLPMIKVLSVADIFTGKLQVPGIIATLDMLVVGNHLKRLCHRVKPSECNKVHIKVELGAQSIQQVHPSIEIFHR